ncbi:MAG: sugar kinase [Proteobacteria bacterium]|nr:sugar kinase [Pseudomonadota bacterium]
MSRAGRAIAIGECMVELARGSDGRFGQSYGGDTFNTAVYLARAGVPVAYATALGDDTYSSGLVALAGREGVATDLVRIRPGRMPGLYLIETTASGERTFYYWRDRSPARELFDGDDAGELVEVMADAPLVYFSGITLSLYSERGLDRLANGLEGARANGAIVAMDGNYRPRGWGGDVARARTVMERFWRLATCGLPTFDDEAMLWGDASPAETIARLASFGVGEVAVKSGPDGACVSDGAVETVVPIPRKVVAIDTTAAGDSFNAAYLAAHLAGEKPEAAARAGHALAGIVVAHRGAIVPDEATRPALANLRAKHRPSASA